MWLRLAGHAGYLAARKALGSSAPPLPLSDKWADLDPWVAAFAEWGRQAAGVAALAAVDVAWERWEPLFHGRDREAVATWLRAARDWVACPCDAHQNAAVTAKAMFSMKFSGEDAPPGGGYILDAVSAVVRLAAGDGPLSVRLPIGNARRSQWTDH
jgi:hypothetical protein